VCSRCVGDKSRRGRTRLRDACVMRSPINTAFNKVSFRVNSDRRHRRLRGHTAACRTADRMWLGGSTKTPIRRRHAAIPPPQQSRVLLLHHAPGSIVIIIIIIGPIPWGHSGPLCHALSLSSWTSMRRRRATVPVATPGESACSGEWAQHFSNASCH